MNKIKYIFCLVIGVILFIASIGFALEIFTSNDILFIIPSLLFLLCSILSVLLFINGFILGEKVYSFNDGVLVCKRKDKIIYEINKSEISNVIKYTDDTMESIVSFIYNNKKYKVYINECNKNAIEGFISGVNVKEKKLFIGFIGWILEVFK